MFFGVSLEQLGTIIKLLQFLCLQLYLVGTLAFIGYLRWQVLKLDSRRMREISRGVSSPARPWCIAIPTRGSGI